MDCSFHHVSRLTYVPAESLDPVQNTDPLAGVEEKDLEFPFVVTEEDRERIQEEGMADVK